MLLSLLSGCSVIVRNKLEPADNTKKDGGVPIDLLVASDRGAPERGTTEDMPQPPRLTGEREDRKFFLIGEQIRLLLPLEVLDRGPATASLTLVNGSDFWVPCDGGLEGDTFQCFIPSRIPEGEYQLSIHPRNSEDVLDSEIVQIQRMLLVGKSNQQEVLAFAADDLHELEPILMGGFPTGSTSPLFSPSGRYLLMSLLINDAAQLTLIDLVLGKSVPLGITALAQVHPEYREISPHSFEPMTLRGENSGQEVSLNYPEQHLWVIDENKKLVVINVPETIQTGRLVPGKVPADVADILFHQVLWAVDPEERKHLIAIIQPQVADSGVRFLSGNSLEKPQISGSSLMGEPIYASYTTPSIKNSDGTMEQRPETLFLVLQEGLVGDGMVKRLSGFVQSTGPASRAFSKALSISGPLLDPRSINPVRGTSIVGFTFSPNPGERVPYGVTMYDKGSDAYIFQIKLSLFNEIDSTSKSMTMEARAYRPMLFVSSGKHITVIELTNDGEQVLFNHPTTEAFLGAQHHPSRNNIYIAEIGQITKFAYGTASADTITIRVDWLQTDGGGMLLQP